MPIEKNEQIATMSMMIKSGKEAFVLSIAYVTVVFRFQQFLTMEKFGICMLFMPKLLGCPPANHEKTL